MSPPVEAAASRNFLLLALHQVVIRVGWIFKTESVIIPAFLDSIAGPGWVRDHEMATGESLSTHEIAARAAEGQVGACASYDRYVDRLARGLATVINVVDPDVVVLGGGMSNLADLPEDLGHALPSYVFTDECSTRVVRSSHGDSSGVRGAAWLWPAAQDPPT